MVDKFSSAELSRYARHIALPDFGLEGQEKLKAASVLVIGSGGLGSPVLLYLAAAGVGHIGIVDFDIIDDSNLQRQILFTVDDLGKSKAETAAKRIKALNPYIKVTVHNTAFTEDNALNIIKDYDVVADGTDNFPTRYLVNDACVLSGKVNVYASILRYEGQVSVFNYLHNDGTRGPHYRNMFPDPPPAGLVPNCAEGGVLGVLPGIIGSIQASEVIKVITGVGESLAGKLFIFDIASFSTKILKINPKPIIEVKELLNYKEFCGISNNEDQLKEISVHELVEMKRQKLDFQLIDVRESFEYEIANIGGELKPLSSIMDNISEISKDRKVIIHCKSGKRSAQAISKLKELHPFTNLYNLKGGILAYSEEIDNSILKY